MTRNRGPGPLRYGLALIGSAACIYLLTAGLSQWGHLSYWAVGAVFAAVAIASGPLPTIAGTALTVIAVILMPLLTPVTAPAWQAGPSEPTYTIHMHSPADAGPQRLRARYRLHELTAGLDDTSRLLTLTGWVHDRLSSTTAEQPASSDPLIILSQAEAGARFRGRECAIVLAAAAQSVDMPARVIGLTAKDTAGHMVAEVWLQDHGKWAFADGQAGFIVMRGGVPLSSVEILEAMASRISLTVRSSDGNVSLLPARKYLAWLTRHLHRLEFACDQRLFVPAPDRMTGGLMLVPADAGPDPSQRSVDVRYTSDPYVFYRDPGLTVIR